MEMLTHMCYTEALQRRFSFGVISASPVYLCQWRSTLAVQILNCTNLCAHHQ
jgi:hypothetical protein